MNVFQKELESRGFLHQYTHEEVFEKFEQGGQKFYFGVDCSANSMTIGNFVALMMAIHFMRKGNKCYLLVGGATSTIGNPSGKDDERPILTPEQLQINQDGIHTQFSRLVENMKQLTGEDLDFELVNNYDFHKDMSTLDYLREVGRYVTVNWMMGKDIVKKRITDPDKSISYAEFSYMLIMGYDYYCLWKDHGVTLEVGGSDEWDGILTGLELVHKKDGGTVYGVTNKLITDSNGKKFGKSEGNAIWLDETKTSPFDMYQYFINTLDSDVERYLRLFSFKSLEDIATISSEHMQEPEKRSGQKILAHEAVSLVHGKDIADYCEKITEFLFGRGDKLELLSGLSDEQFNLFFSEVGGVKYSGQSLTELFIESGLEQSSSSARRSLKEGGLNINEEKLSDIEADTESFFGERNFILLRKGKKNYRIIKK